MKLNKEVFSKKDFKSGVEKDFVVVVLDFPRSKKLPKAEAAANKALAKKYKITAYPTVLLMDSSGKVFKQASGYRGGGVDSYLKGLQDSLKAKKFK